MVRRKGLKRRMHYGLHGPKMETLIKTLDKQMKRGVAQAGTKFRMPSYKSFEFIAIKRFRRENKIAIARALDSIGVDPKTAKNRLLRAWIQKQGQRLSDLFYAKEYDLTRKRDPQTHTDFNLVQRLINSMLLVQVGPEKARKFWQVFERKQRDIEIAHEEIAQRDQF